MFFVRQPAAGRASVLIQTLLARLAFTLAKAAIVGRENGQLVATVQRSQCFSQQSHIAGVSVKQQGVSLRLLMSNVPTVEIRAVRRSKFRVLGEHRSLVPFAGREFGWLKDPAGFKTCGW